MRKLILISFLALLSPSAAFAQSGCNGQTSSGFVCGNNQSGTGLPNLNSLTSILDRALSSTPGMMIYRGSSNWQASNSPALGANGGSGGSLVLNGATSGSAQISVAAAAGSVLFQLPITNGASNNVLITDGSGHTSWTNAGSGSVSSVGLALPSNTFTVTNSPVISTGTLTGTYTVQTANTALMGPANGVAATPSWRALVGADLPNPTTSSLGGVQAINAVTSNWIRSINSSGVPQLSQPAFSDISGSIAPTQCPNPSATTLGCVESLAATTSQWINSISTSGVPISSQPSFSDIAGNASLSQLPSISNNSVLGNNSGGTSIPAALSASNVLDMIDNTQGDVLYRNATGWVQLPPGTSGQVLTTGGTAANPSWTSVTGTGTVITVQMLEVVL